MAPVNATYKSALVGALQTTNSRVLRKTHVDDLVNSLHNYSSLGPARWRPATGGVDGRQRACLLSKSYRKTQVVGRTHVLSAYLSVAGRIYVRCTCAYTSNVCMIGDNLRFGEWSICVNI